ncbi:MAG: MMPL family transporter [Solirubrobacteraceae bacterium]
MTDQISPSPPSTPAALTGLSRLVTAAARRASRRPKLTILLWLAWVLAAVVTGSISGTRSLSDAASGVGESAQAQLRLSQAGIADPATESILVSSRSRADTATTVTALSARARRLDGVRSVQTPADSPALSRAAGRTGLVVVTLGGDPNAADNHVEPLQRAVAGVRAQHPGVTVREAGEGSIGHAIAQTVQHGLRRAELISLPITLLILILAFGALVAASVPLLLGMTSVAAALGASSLVSQLVPNGNSTAPVVVLIGLAVGVDYSLFYIRRERAERRAGARADAALRAASASVGRAIVVAGATVVIGLAGLLVTGFGVFTSMALGAILVVGIAVSGSLTVLPAALALLGDSVDRGRLWHRRPGSPLRPGFWARLARSVTAHPRGSLAAALVLLVGLTTPVLGMRTANPGTGDLPAGTPAIVAEHAIDHAFPGTTQTAELVVSGHRLATPQARARLAALGRRGETIAAATGAVSVRVASTGDTALVTIPVRDQRLGAAHATVGALRRQLEPATSRLLPGARAQLGGSAAQDVDFTNRLTSVTPLVIAFVLVLAFALLVAAFRSPRLAIAVIGLNLLSVGAAFGVLVAVFQHRWAQSLLHFNSDGAVVNWLPLFAFVVLFGLSMDYTVLILERAREARGAGADARRAAAEALAATGGTVTSAALVMVAVFAIFATLPLLEFKQLGVGLAAAIALDATIVRGLALPAVLTLLGDRGLDPAATRRPRHDRRWDHAASVRTLDTAHD